MFQPEAIINYFHSPSVHGFFSASTQEFKTVQFGHGNVGYRVIESVEPIRDKRDTTSSNSSSTSSILECYQFTWPGVTENNTVPDCARIKKYVPCFTPFVFTSKNPLKIRRNLNDAYQRLRWTLTIATQMILLLPSPIQPL